MVSNYWKLNIKRNIQNTILSHTVLCLIVGVRGSGDLFLTNKEFFRKYSLGFHRK